METIQEKELYQLFYAIALLANSNKKEGKKIIQDFNKISTQFEFTDE